VSQRAKILLAVSTLTAAACDRQTHETHDGAHAVIAQPPEPSIAVGSANQSTSTHTGALDAGAEGRDEILVGEERERDPRSDTVKVKVVVDQRRQAHVLWGRKDFGVAPLEVERPRNSGPLDLVMIAPGYLPYHARAFTDRDDLISVHLYAATDAPQLLGYRASDVPGAARAPRSPSSNQNGRENRPRNATKAARPEVTKVAQPLGSATRSEQAPREPEPDQEPDQERDQGPDQEPDRERAKDQK
jgi:hypothetical protein